MQVFPGDCLEAEIYAGGCHGNTPLVDLCHWDAIGESCPVQRYLELSLENREFCNAMVNTKFAFDLSLLRTDDDLIIFNLEGWEEICSIRKS